LMCQAGHHASLAKGAEHRRLNRTGSWQVSGCSFILIRQGSGLVLFCLAGASAGTNCSGHCSYKCHRWFLKKRRLPAPVQDIWISR